MIARLKRSELGSRLYRISRLPVIGPPLRLIARIVQSEAVQPAHLLPANLAHNARQRRVLAAFEADRSNTRGA